MPAARPDAARVAAVSVTGTSGTVVPVDPDGAAVGAARLYDDSSGERAPRRGRASTGVSVARPDGDAAARASGGAAGPRPPTSSTRRWPVARWPPTPRTGSRPASTSSLGAGRSTRCRAIGFDPAETAAARRSSSPARRIGTVDPAVAAHSRPPGRRRHRRRDDRRLHGAARRRARSTTATPWACSEPRWCSRRSARRRSSPLTARSTRTSRPTAATGPGVRPTPVPGCWPSSSPARTSPHWTGRWRTTVAGYVRYPLSVAGERFPVADRRPAPADRRRAPQPARRIPGPARGGRVRRTARSRTARAARRHPTPARHRRRRHGQPGLEPDPGHRPRAHSSRSASPDRPAAASAPRSSRPTRSATGR